MLYAWRFICKVFTMKIYCEDCDNLVAEGELKEGKKRKAFVLEEKPNGTILKNKSNNPNDWLGICSKCQREKNDKNKKKS